MGYGQVGGDSLSAVLWLHPMDTHNRKKICWYAGQVRTFIRTSEYLQKNQKNKNQVQEKKDPKGQEKCVPINK